MNGCPEFWFGKEYTARWGPMYGISWGFMVNYHNTRDKELPKFRLVAFRRYFGIHLIITGLLLPILTYNGKIFKRSTRFWIWRLASFATLLMSCVNLAMTIKSGKFSHDNCSCRSYSCLYDTDDRDYCCSEMWNDKMVFNDGELAPYDFMMNAGTILAFLSQPIFWLIYFMEYRAFKKSSRNSFNTFGHRGNAFGQISVRNRQIRESANTATLQIHVRNVETNGASIIQAKNDLPPTYEEAVMEDACT